MKNIELEIYELRQMSAAALRTRYAELFGRAPRVKSHGYLWRRCAWKLQEKRFGGLSGAAKQRLEELIAEIDLPASEQPRSVAGKLTRPRKSDDPPIGTVITREWHGKEIAVKVVDGGFEHDGVVHPTLSAVAKAVTGAHWNGKLFFGLTKRKRAK